MSANSVQGKNGKETRGTKNVKMRQITKKKKKKKTATGARGHTNTNTVPMTEPRLSVRVAWCLTYSPCARFKKGV